MDEFSQESNQFLNKRNVIALISLLLLISAVIAGLILVKTRQILKPRAGGAAISFSDSSGSVHSSCDGTNNSDGTPKCSTSQTNINLVLDSSGLPQSWLDVNPAATPTNTPSPTPTVPASSPSPTITSSPTTTITPDLTITPTAAPATSTPSAPTITPSDTPSYNAPTTTIAPTSGGPTP